MKHFILILLLLLIISCAPIYVNYDYETGTNFGQYKTYNIYPELISGLSELDENRLLDAIDEVLQQKGFKVSQSPDIFVNIKSQEFESFNNSNVGVGVGGTGGNVGGGVSVGIPINRTSINRELTFDFIDAQKDRLIWQAISESGYNPNASPEKRKEKFIAIVTKVFSKYPPKN